MQFTEPQDTEREDNACAFYGDLLRRALSGRTFIVVDARPRKAERVARQLRGYDATVPLVVTTAPTSGPDSVGVHVLDVGPNGPDPAAHQFAWSRAAAARLGDDGPGRRATETADPQRAAWVYGLHEMSVPRLLGRPRFGWRRPHWEAYEDKVQIDAFWDRWKVPRAPSRIVDATIDAVGRVRASLDQGTGIVMAADATKGLHGGATKVRYARNDAQLAEAIQALAPSCRSVRVMPYVEGTPCSVHGIVFPAGTAVFRPMELLVVLANDGRFVFSGTNTHWKVPQARLLDDVRRTVRRVGDGLRAEAGYRGFFAVDGILTQDGFLPTELNARMASGVADGNPVPGLPLELLSRVAHEVEDLDFRHELLEATVVTAMDRRPAVECIRYLPSDSWTGDVDALVSRINGQVTDSLRAQFGIAVAAQPAAAGVMLQYSRTRDSDASEQPLGPLLADAFAELDRQLAAQVTAIDH